MWPTVRRNFGQDCQPFKTSLTFGKIRRAFLSQRRGPFRRRLRRVPRTARIRAAHEESVRSQARRRLQLIMFFERPGCSEHADARVPPAKGRGCGTWFVVQDNRDSEDRRKARQRRTESNQQSAGCCRPDEYLRCPASSSMSFAHQLDAVPVSLQKADIGVAADG